MNRAILFLQKLSTGKTVLILFVITNLIYGLMLGYSIPLVSNYAPESMLFDMSPSGYNYTQAIELLQSLGVEGRNKYLTVQIPIDFIYPGLFAVSYSLLIVWVLKQYRPVESKLFWFAFVPMFAGLFDYIENVCIIAMLTSFPDVSELGVTTASSFTVGKSVLTTIFFVFLFISLIFFVKSILNNKRELID